MFDNVAMSETPKKNPDWVSEFDAGAMGCGELVLELRSRLREIEPGQVLRLIAEDPGAVEDIPAWCRMTGNSIVDAKHPVYLIERKRG